MRKISMDKKYKTRDGSPVTVLSTSVKGPKPVVVVIHGADRPDTVQQYVEDGYHYEDSGLLSSLDLLEADVYEPGEIVEVKTVLGWRPWYQYHSCLEDGVHLVKMLKEVCESALHPLMGADAYVVVNSDDLRVSQEY